MDENAEEAANPLVNLPGLSTLREAVANRPNWLPRRKAVGRDALAGLNTAIANLPDGLANGLLVGVNPIHGLYATMVGPFVGGIVSSTQLMVISTTAAASLTAGQALAGAQGESRATVMALMVMLIGLFQVLFGILGLGRLSRFVSYSVMTGLLSGIAALLVLSQFPTIAGYAAQGAGKVAQAIEVVTSIREVHLPTVAVAALSLALALLLPRTPLGNFGRLLAIVVPSLVVALVGGAGVRLVSDVGEIPRGFPLPALPDFSVFSLDVVTGAAAVALVVLVQGVGVSQSVPNPDGSRRRISRDFVAQGAANLASGLFRGLPIGGSMSTTAINVLSGAGSRWAAIFAGLWMAAFLVIVPGLVSLVAMPALGALLIVAGLSSLKPADIVSVNSAGWPSLLAAVTTFVATLFLPIQAAVGIGVVLSALLFLVRASTDVTVVELTKLDDGRIEEHRPDNSLADDEVTVFDVYGDLFYAGARTLERLLPDPRSSSRPAVVLRLRGQRDIGATLTEVLKDYSAKVEAAGGRLYLSGINASTTKQLKSSGKFDLEGPMKVYEMTPILLESTTEAVTEARAWLITTKQGEEDSPEGA